MNANYQQKSQPYSFSKYSEDSKTISFCTTISIILIFIFIITPLSSNKIICIISKIIVLIILLFALYKNLFITYKFIKSEKISYLDGTWSNIKNNILCSYIYSFFIFFLIVTVIKSVF